VYFGCWACVHFPTRIRIFEIARTLCFAPPPFYVSIPCGAFKLLFMVETILSVLCSSILN
jgi:hypothetical protein